MSFTTCFSIKLDSTIQIKNQSIKFIFHIFIFIVFYFLTLSYFCNKIKGSHFRFYNKQICIVVYQSIVFLFLLFFSTTKHEALILNKTRTIVPHESVPHESIPNVVGCKWVFAQNLIRRFR